MLKSFLAAVLLSALVKIFFSSHMRDFLNMFWRAEGLGCIGMLFDFGLLTSKLCLGFSLEKQKN